MIQSSCSCSYIVSEEQFSQVNGSQSASDAQNWWFHWIFFEKRCHSQEKVGKDVTYFSISLFSRLFFSFSRHPPLSSQGDSRWTNSPHSGVCNMHTNAPSRDPSSMRQFSMKTRETLLIVVRCSRVILSLSECWCWCWSFFFHPVSIARWVMSVGHLYRLFFAFVSLTLSAFKLHQ